MKPSVVIVNQVSGYQMIDIANAYSLKGYSVSLITGTLVKREKDLSSGIKLIKVQKYNNQNAFYRIFTWVLATIQIYFILLFRFPKSHIFVVTNPPLLQLLMRFLPNKYTYLVYDVYPDVFLEGKVFSEKSFIFKYWREANIKTFAKADRIITIAEGMKLSLSRYVDKIKVEVIPLRGDNSFYKPIPKQQNPFAKRYLLEDKFVVLYSGNIGALSQAEILIEIAGKIENEKVFFVIIGAGAKFDDLADLVKISKLKNIMILPWLPIDETRYSFAAADLAIAATGTVAVNLGIPSRTYDFMSVGAPILAITNSNSDVTQLIQQYEVGKSFEIFEFEEIIKYINQLSTDDKLRKYYSEKSLQAIKDLSRSNLDQIIGC